MFHVIILHNIILPVCLFVCVSCVTVCILSLCRAVFLSLFYSLRHDSISPMCQNYTMKYGVNYTRKCFWSKKSDQSHKSIKKLIFLGSCMFLLKEFRLSEPLTTSWKFIFHLPFYIICIYHSIHSTIRWWLRTCCASMM